MSSAIHIRNVLTALLIACVVTAPVMAADRCSARCESSRIREVRPLTVRPVERMSWQEKRMLRDFWRIRALAFETDMNLQVAEGYVLPLTLALDFVKVRNLGSLQLGRWMRREAERDRNERVQRVTLRALQQLQRDHDLRSIGLTELEGLLFAPTGPFGPRANPPAGATRAVHSFLEGLKTQRIDNALQAMQQLESQIASSEEETRLLRGDLRNAMRKIADLETRISSLEASFSEQEESDRLFKNIEALRLNAQAIQSIAGEDSGLGRSMRDADRLLQAIQLGAMAKSNPLYALPAMMQTANFLSGLGKADPRSEVAEYGEAILAAIQQLSTQIQRLHEEEMEAIYGVSAQIGALGKIVYAETAKEISSCETAVPERHLTTHGSYNLLAGLPTVEDLKAFHAASALKTCQRGIQLEFNGKELGPSMRFTGDRHRLLADSSETHTLEFLKHSFEPTLALALDVLSDSAILEAQVPAIDAKTLLGKYDRVRVEVAAGPVKGSDIARFREPLDPVQTARFTSLAIALAFTLEVAPEGELLVDNEVRRDAATVHSILDNVALTANLASAQQRLVAGDLFLFPVLALMRNDIDNFRALADAGIVRSDLVSGTTQRIRRTFEALRSRLIPVLQNNLLLLQNTLLLDLWMSRTEFPDPAVLTFSLAGLQHTTFLPGRLVSDWGAKFDGTRWVVRPITGLVTSLPSAHKLIYQEFTELPVSTELRTISYFCNREIAANRFLSGLSQKEFRRVQELWAVGLDPVF